MRLRDKVALITGSTRGIGKAIAHRFAAEGARVVVNGRDGDLGQQVTEAIQQMGGKAAFVPGDVGVRDDVSRIFEQVRSTFGEVEILVNNAAIHESRSFREMTEEQWDRIFQVNLKGAFYCCKQAVEPMITMKKGVILNLTSIAAKTGGGLPVAHYAASKAALLCLTKSLARELAEFCIRVNALAPGTVRTDMTSSFGDSKIAEIPLGRLAEDEEVAVAAVFLCSDEAGYITGEILDVNGGQYMD